jgi:hypothetical protein
MDGNMYVTFKCYNDLLVTDTIYIQGHVHYWVLYFFHSYSPWECNQLL